MSRTFQRWAIVSLFAALVAPSRAERLEFVGGGTIEGPVRLDGERVVYEGLPGWWIFDRSDFTTIEPSSRPPDLWPARRDQARAEGLDARFAAAWWALENGLTAEAIGELRAIHRVDPGHQPTARMVTRLDTLQTDAPVPEIPRWLSQTRASWRVARSPHVLLIHQLDANEVAPRLELLENVLLTFDLSFTAHGLELAPAGAKAIVVWCRDPSTYRALIDRMGAAKYRGTRGFFDPVSQVIYTYRGSRAWIDDRDGTRTNRPTRSDQERAVPEPSIREARRRALLETLERVEIEQAAAAHEMAHWLVRSRGLAPRHESLPVWLHEGLAMQFEAVHDGRWAGIGRLNPQRVPFCPGVGEPLRLDRLLRDEGFERGYDARVYARAWAFVSFLRTEHPRALLDLLEHLRAAEHLAAGPGANLRAAQTLSRLLKGGLPELEASWNRYLEREIREPSKRIAQNERATPKKGPPDSDKSSIAPAGIEPTTSRL